MVANRIDPPAPGKGGSGSAAAGAAGAAAEAEGAKTEAPASPAGGGLKPWLPLIAAVVVMPVLAYLTTTFVLVPKLEKAVGKSDANVSAAAEASEKTGEKTGEKSSEKTAAKSKHGSAPAAAGRKFNQPLKKVLVNVKDTQGTRFLLVNMTLAVGGEEYKAKIEESEAQLSDVASSTLASKTINDLEKAGARNLIRTELIAAFNGVLGKDAVQEIYFTEFAVQ
jgi:flagellar basal body-associated protein FliL